MTTSNNLKLSKTLFKSFLRWNRRSHILQSKFSIDMIGIGLSQYIPDNYASFVSNKEGIQGAIFHCFRNQPKNEISTSKTLDMNQISLGFKVLKELNLVSEELLKRYDARKKRLEIEELSKVDSNISITYRIGQVVQHQDLKIRGIVIGWEYDQQMNIQLVNVLIDIVDVSQFPSTEYNRPNHTIPSKFKFHSCNLSLVHDEALKRVVNLNLKDYFDGYDSLTSRYVANEDLSYWYEKDLMIQQLQDKDNKSLEMIKESQLFNQSLLNVGNNVLSLSKKLQNIVDKHLTSTHTANTKTPLTMTSEAAIQFSGSTTTTKDLKDNVVNDIKVNMQFITNNVLGEVKKSINGCTTAAVCAMDSRTNDNSNSSIINNLANEVIDSNKQEHAFYQPLRLGGQLHYRNNLQNSSHSMDNSVTTSSSSTSQYQSEQPINYKLQQIQPNSLLQFNRSQIEQIYYSLGYLGNCFTAIDQLLQLRFQNQGLAYHDGLKLSNDYVSPTDSTSIDSNNLLVNTKNETVNDCINATNNDSYNTINNKFNIIEIPSTNKQVNRWNDESKTPTAVFQVGQVIKHKIFGYRGVISGFEQRPTIDMSRWEGIKDLQYGQEQPIYKVIPDENEVEEKYGTGAYRHSYLVAQENIMLIDSKDNNQYRIKHKSMNKYFLGFDPNTKSYRVPHMLRYCYPYNSSVLSSIPNVLGSNEFKDIKIDNTIDKQSVEYLEQKIKIEQANIYHQIDCLLVDLLDTLRNTFSNSRKQIISDNHHNRMVGLDSSLDNNSNSIIAMKDLLKLLKHAYSLDQALYVESLLWIIWISHDSIDINRLMRLSTLHARRGNNSKAIDMTNQIISLDPTFAEAYNKRAAFQQSNLQYNKCAESAKKALELFPAHFGALSGLSLSHEKQGEHSEAIDEIRNVLKLHPWAANLPSLLITLLDNNAKKTEK